MSPSDRYSGRVESDGGASPLTPQSSPVLGYDRLRTQVSAQTPAGVRLRLELSDRDIGVLTSIQAFRLLQVEQVRRLHFTDHQTTEASKRICRRVLQRLHDRDLLHRLERRVGGIRAGSSGHVYALAPVGHRLLGGTRRRRRSEPSLGFVQHTLAIAEIATRLIAEAPERGVEILDVSPEPFCWRHPIGTATKTASTAIVKPDLHIVVADPGTELNWFIEVDCGTEAPTTIAKKCRVYTDYFRSGAEQKVTGIFPKVLWIAPDENRRALIERAIKRDGIEPALFETTIFDRALEAITDAGGTP